MDFMVDCADGWSVGGGGVCRRRGGAEETNVVLEGVGSASGVGASIEVGRCEMGGFRCVLAVGCGGGRKRNIVGLLL